MSREDRTSPSLSPCRRPGTFRAIRSEAGDDKRRTFITLSGTLRDGKLDASGAFANGRAVQLDWQRQ